MATFKLNAAFDSMNGKIGEMVLSNSLGGQTIRARNKPADPHSASQLNFRAATARFSRQWVTLTSAQRTAWIAYADARTRNSPAGNTRALTGISAFVGTNQSLDTIGAPPVLLPPPMDAVVSRFISGSGTLGVSVVRGTSDAKLAVVRGSPDPAHSPTEGLHSSKKTGDLTVNQTARSGDLRRTEIGATDGDITSFTLSLQLVGGGELLPEEKIYARMTEPCSAGRSLNVVLRKQSAINAGNPYTTLTPDVLEDYCQRFGSAIAAWQQIGVSIKIINAQTGASSDYLRFLVMP